MIFFFKNKILQKSFPKNIFANAVMVKCGRKFFEQEKKKKTVINGGASLVGFQFFCNIFRIVTPLFESSGAFNIDEVGVNRSSCSIFGVTISKTLAPVGDTKSVAGVGKSSEIVEAVTLTTSCVESQVAKMAKMKKWVSAKNT